MKRRLACRLLAVWPLLAVTGCAAFPWLRPQPAPALPPRVFGGSPTLEDVICAVNSNSARVTQLQSQGATLTLPGAPALRANLALEPPRRFRMRAELFGFSGPEIDLGANDEVVWIWARRSQPPAVYFVRRGQLGASAARSVMPVDPDWLPEAMGLARLDPAGVHEGPFPLDPGRFEVRSQIVSAAGPLTKQTVVDGAYGWVLEQHLYDPAGRLMASARASQHRFYPLAGVSLPHRVEVQVSPLEGPGSLSFQLDMHGYLINQLNADPAQVWAMPRQEGYPLIDLADPRFAPLPYPPQEAPLPGYERRPPPEAPYRPIYRVPAAS